MVWTAKMKITELLIESEQAAFVQQNYNTAKEVGDQLGVDPKHILGHWALETGWGKSVIPGTNNLGNIKDFSGKGGVKAYDATEKSNDAYRQYSSTSDFAKDYANLLAKKYPGVVGAGSDPDAFVQGLQGGKNRYASGDFATVYAGMPASVEKYLGKNASWNMDPTKIMAAVKDAPANVKNYVSQNLSALTSNFTSPAPEPSDEVEVVINGKKRKFKNKREAQLAMAQAQQDASA